MEVARASNFMWSQVLAMDDVIRVDNVPLVRGIDDFDEFYRAEYRSVLGLSIVLGGSRPAAEEITQDAFLAAFKNWDKISRYDKPEAWVKRVVANRSVSRVRKLTAEAKALIRHGRPTDAAPDTAAMVDVDLWNAVRRLPHRQAQAIALTYICDLARKDVAEILGCSPETVKTHLERGRATLARRLESHNGGTDGN